MSKSIQLNPELLRFYRNKVGFTLKKLAETALVESEGYSKGSQLRTYQKIEKDGKTSPTGARLIAKALNVSVSDLEHPNIQDRKLKQVELMKCAVKKMQEANDKEGLIRIAQVLGFQQEDSQEEWDTVCDKEYADLSDKIEWLHLFGEAGELDSFAKLFELTAQQLRPAPLASFWMVSCSNPFRYCHSLGKLVSGHAGVLDEIKENWEALPERFHNEPETIKATVSKDGKQYRLRFEYTAIRPTLTFTCLFYACDTTEKTGLPSINASKWEEDELMKSLKSFLFDHAYTVVIDDEQFPPEDKTEVFQIRFFNIESQEVEKLEGGYGSYVKSDGKWYQKVKKQIFNGTRIFDDNLLFRGSLLTLLKKHNADDWKFFAAFENPNLGGFPGVQMWLHENEPESKYYEIRKGWLEDDGAFHEGHWPRVLREQFIMGYQNFKDSWIIVRDENEVIPLFEPEQQSSASEGVAV